VERGSKLSSPLLTPFFSLPFIHFTYILLPMAESDSLVALLLTSLKFPNSSLQSIVRGNTELSLFC
jgi:hypothetical protein